MSYFEWRRGVLKEANEVIEIQQSIHSKEPLRKIDIFSASANH